MSTTLFKKLAGHTAIYGLSTVVGRLLNYLLTPYLTRRFATSEYGVVTDLYSFVGFMMVIFTYGMETAFFRYIKDADDPYRVYSTAMISIGGTTLVLATLLILFLQPLGNLLLYPDQLSLILCVIFILAFDALVAIPFAYLRYTERPVKFSIIRIINISIFVGLILFFLKLCPELAEQGHTWVHRIYDPSFGVGYVFIANLIASICTFLLLLPEILRVRWQFDPQLWKTMLIYSLPLVIVGFSGSINELLDRFILKYLLPDSFEENMAQVGIYGAVYKLSILMSLFTQAFRMGAEPFFFQQSNNKEAKDIYALSMKYFIIVGCFIFMGVVLFIDLFQYFIGQDFRVGLKVVPVLLLANLFLGIYYNLSIWYKLTNKTLIGAGIALIGALITVILNILLIPSFSYVGSAWTTLICYTIMVAISYQLCQRFFPIPYNIRRICTYIGIAIGVVLIEIGIISTLNPLLAFPIRIGCLLGFAGLVIQLENIPWRTGLQFLKRKG